MSEDDFADERGLQATLESLGQSAPRELARVRVDRRPKPNVVFDSINIKARDVSKCSVVEPPSPPLPTPPELSAVVDFSCEVDGSGIGREEATGAQVLIRPRLLL